MCKPSTNLPKAQNVTKRLCMVISLSCKQYLRLDVDIFEFSDTIVREIMTPRTDTICISDAETVQSAIHLISNEGHSRVPVYEDKMDNIIGIIYAKDLLNVPISDGAPNIRKFMRSAVFIPEFDEWHGSSSWPTTVRRGGVYVQDRISRDSRKFCAF